METKHNPNLAAGMARRRKLCSVENMFATSTLFLAFNFLVANEILVLKVWKNGAKSPDVLEIEARDFPTLQEYEVIEMMYNKLTLKNGTIRDLPNLKSLHIYFAKIEEVPPGSFQNLPELIDLSLENHQITSISPAVFNHLPSLKKLSLMMNEINDISPSAFDNMMNLHTIILDRNKLKKIDRNWFRNCPNLTIISFKENQISEIPEAAFQNLGDNGRALEIILTNNSIKNIHYNAFQGLAYLEVLRLDDNLIKEIPYNLFERFFMVRKLDLSFNNLERQDEYTFRNVKQLLMEGNPNVDCNFASLFEAYGQNKTIDIKRNCGSFKY